MTFKNYGFDSFLEVSIFLASGFSAEGSNFVSVFSNTLAHFGLGFDFLRFFSNPLAKEGVLL